MSDERQGGLLKTARGMALEAVRRVVDRLLGVGEPRRPALVPRPHRPSLPAARLPEAGPAAAAAPRTGPPGTPGPTASAGHGAPSSIDMVRGQAPAPVEMVRGGVPAPVRKAAPEAARRTPAEPVPLAPIAQQAPPRPAAPPPPIEPIGLLDLEEPPESYGIDEIGLLVRDPQTVFVWWEATPAGQARARAALGRDGALTVRLTIHAAGAEEPTIRDVFLTWVHGRMYVDAPTRGGAVHVALGLAADGRFAAIADTGGRKMPSGVPGPEEPVTWMEVLPAVSGGSHREPPRVVRRGAAAAMPGADGSTLPRVAGPTSSPPVPGPAAGVGPGSSPAGPPSSRRMKSMESMESTESTESTESR